ncbi:hypothetical protein Sjap_000643 [Stephania japonica]|uniref:Uncharacterized protein n=1 Tax=Stephania japonica TaxID=461633 RepID=A0AAP0KIG3_9MAGN
MRLGICQMQPETVSSWYNFSFKLCDELIRHITQTGSHLSSRLSLRSKTDLSSNELMRSKRSLQHKNSK